MSFSQKAVVARQNSLALLYQWCNIYNENIKTNVMKKEFYFLLICGAAWLGCKKDINIQSFPTIENNFAVADGTKTIFPNDNRFYANGGSSDNTLSFSNSYPSLL